MVRRFIAHLSNNVVGYVALFAALGGTSFAAVRLSAGSVTSQALAPGSVTHSKLAPNSVTGSIIRNGSLTRADFARGTLSGATGASGSNGTNGSSGGRGSDGTSGHTGAAGPAGPTGPAGAAGANGSSSIVARAAGTGAVNAPHGGATDVPIGSGTWSQGAGELDLITGTAKFTIPSACTGSFGNALVLSVDGTPATFALAPTTPAGGTVTMPFNVTSVMEPAGTASHHITASLANSCTKGGEDFTVNDVKVDVVAFK